MTKNEILAVKEILGTELKGFKGFYFNRNIKRNLKIVEEYIEDIQKHIQDLAPEGFDEIQTKINEYNEKIKELSSDLEALKEEYNSMLTKDNTEALQAEYSPKFETLQEQFNLDVEPLNEEYKEDIDIYNKHNKVIEEFLAEEAEDIELIQMNIEHIPDLVLDGVGYNASLVLEELIDDDETTKE